MSAIVGAGLDKKLKRGFIISWALGCIFYLLQYAIRSSPAVMIGELSDAFNLSPFEISSKLKVVQLAVLISSPLGSHLVLHPFLHHCMAKPWRYPRIKRLIFNLPEFF